MNITGSSSKPDRAVLLPIDMGNYGRNRQPVKEIFKELHDHPIGVRFISYHWRPSGNFVFDDYGEEIRQKALEAGEAVIGLKCIIRTFLDLGKVVQAGPPEAQIKHGSVILPTGEKLIHVALSKSVIETPRPTGRIGRRVEILTWPSPQDVLCAYDRPQKRGGDVGQVTNNVLKILRIPSIYGTGRALSVIRDLLENRNIRYGQ